MPSFVNGGTFSASLDEWDVLTINGPGTLRITVASSPTFETTTFGLQRLGPYAQTAVITGVMTGNGNYSVGPTNTAVGLLVVDISPAQLVAPTTAMLLASNTFYRLNVAPFAIYQSNGTTLTTQGASNVFTSTTPGLVPASGGGTATFLRADGVYASPPGTAYTPFNATTVGLVPASGGGTTSFLRADGSFATPAGGGDMALAATQTVAGAKTFNDSTVILAGLTSGTTIVKTSSVAGASIVTIPATTDTLVGRGTTDTLTNKTLTSPVIASIVNGAATLSLPITTDVLVGRAVVETLTNKTLTAPVITAPVISGISAAPTQTANDNSTKLATTAYADAIGALSATIIGTQTLTNKTLTTPSIASILSSGSLLTLPPTVDTLVGRATVDTLTNKTLTAPVITGSSVVPTQAPGDNSTKIASTAYADAVGASKATAGVFTSSTVGQVPASGGGTTSFLRADGVFSSVTAALDSAVVIPAAITIPLDRAGQGRYMPASLLAAASTLTVGTGAVENGNCVFCLVGDGIATHVPDITAFRMMNGYAYNYATNAANTYSAVWLYGTPRLYGEQGNDLSIIPPTLVSAVVPNAAPLTMVLTWSKPMNTTVSAFSAFAISAGHTISAHTNTTATTTTLTFSTAYAPGEAPSTLAYTQPGTNQMKDTVANLAASFFGFAITNNVFPAFTAQSAPAGTGGTAYSYQYVASGATSYVLGTGSLPAGLTISGSGLLSGTPSAGATYTFTINAVNAGGSTASTSQSVVITGSIVVLSDNFNRANQTLSAAVASDGGTWTEFPTGQLSIVSNKVTSGGGNSGHAVRNTTHSDGYVQATVFTGPSATSMYPALTFRGDGTNQNYLEVYFQTGGVQLYSVAAGTGAIQGAVQTGATIPNINSNATGQVCRVDFTSTTITAKIDGVTAGTWTSSIGTTRTWCGFFDSPTAESWDDWSAG